MHEGRSFSAAAIVFLFLMSSASVVMMAQPNASASGEVFLDERFDSWAGLNPGWTIWNGTKNTLNGYFDVREHQLFSSHYLASSVMAGDYTDATANWTADVVYASGLIISFNVYIPERFPEVIGYVGNVFHFSVYDVSGACAISTRFGSMDNYNVGPNYVNPPGFAYFNGAGWVLISNLVGGWHSISIVMDKSATTWTVYYDGIRTTGLTYSYTLSAAPDVSKIQFSNGLKEEIQDFYIDNVKIEEGLIPAAWNTPPVARFTVDPSIGEVSTVFAVDASASSDRQDSVVSLQVRWDWEDDGVYDTSWSSEKTATHSYDAPGIYEARVEVADSAGLVGEESRSLVVQDVDRSFLAESYSSWSSVNSHWTVTNGTYYDAGGGGPYSGGPYYGTWNYMGVVDGRFVMKSNYAMTPSGLPSMRNNGYADWTNSQGYSTTLRTTFQVFLPPDPYFRIPWGFSGTASATVSLYDPSGQAGLALGFGTVWGQDSWNVLDGLTSTVLTSVAPGWHDVSIVTIRGDSTWSLTVDGIVFEGMDYASAVSFDVLKIRISNGCTMGCGGLVFDNFGVGEIFPEGVENLAPAATFSVTPTSIGSGSTVFTFDASSCWDREDPSSALMVRWDWDGDGIYDTDRDTVKITTHAYSASSPLDGYPVALEVTDTAGLTSSTYRMVKVDATPPVAAAGPDQVGSQGVPMFLDGRASSDNFGIASYVWTYLDVTPRTLTGSYIYLTFPTAGTYVITLTVTDVAGNTAQDTVTFTIEPRVVPDEPVVIEKTTKTGMNPVAWSYSATNSQFMCEKIESRGFKSMVLEVYDLTQGTKVKVYHEVINFRASGAYPYGIVYTPGWWVTQGHDYEIVAKDFSGPVGSWMTIWEVTSQSQTGSETVGFLTLQHHVISLA